jgi:hypothetical protein
VALIVQSKFTSWVSLGYTGITATFDSAPTAGNQLIAFVYEEEMMRATASGWTLAENAWGRWSDGQYERLTLWTRTAGVGEPSAVTFNLGTGLGTNERAALAIIEASASVDISDVVNGGSGSLTTFTGPTITASGTGAGAMLTAFMPSYATYVTPSITPNGSLVELGEAKGSGRLVAWFGSQEIASLSGAYTHSVTSDLRPYDTQDGYDWAAVSVILSGEPADPPVPGVLVDWDDDGFDPLDVLGEGHIESWRITRGASPEVTGGATPGSATVVLNNPDDDRYNPLNESGPLYGLLRDGVPIWIGINSDGAMVGPDPRGLFGGRIKDVTPIPSAGGGRALKVELQCEDALGWLDRTPVTIPDSLFRSHGALRAAILAAAGETRTSLAHEITTAPLSSWDGSASSALEQLNRANGTRHFAHPADSAGDWYDYVTRNRQWRLDGIVDASVDAGDDHVTGSDGWRLSADTVINQQRATVTPISFTSGQVSAWEAETLPFTFTGSRVFWPEFDDYLDAPVVDINYTGTAPTATLESFGATGKLTLVTAGTTTVTGLSIEGRLARRGVAESHVADDLTSQAGPRGIRSGSEISGDWVGVLASARGIAEHVVWRYGSPQYRPTLTIHNWFPEMFEVDLYDVIAVTIAQLGMTARHFEIVGLTHEGRIAASATVCHHILTLVLQECRVQADPGWFILDSSLLDGADVLAY